jgi:hypothetical protein
MLQKETPLLAVERTMGSRSLAEAKKPCTEESKHLVAGSNLA